MKKYLAIILLLMIVVPTVASAQVNASNPCGTAPGQPPMSIGQCVSRLYIWSLAAAAILALLYMVYGGYIVMTAAGNASQATKGKEYLQSSVIGLALLLGAYLILNTINPDLVSFQITGFNQPPPGPAPTPAIPPATTPPQN